jgi:hypothetical protein
MLFNQYALIRKLFSFVLFAFFLFVKSSLLLYCSTKKKKPKIMVVLTLLDIEFPSYKDSFYA